MRGCEIVSYVTLDLKIKNLIQVCNVSGNFKKLAVVGFQLTSQQLDRIGKRLGTRTRNHESMVEYMELINRIFDANLGILIFQKDLIEKVRDCEPLFLGKRGDIPKDSIKTIYTVYYELRGLDIPDLNKKMEEYNFGNNSATGLMSYLSSNSKRKRNNGVNDLKPLILQKIRGLKSNLKNQSQFKLSSYTLEQAISLKGLEDSLTNHRSRKIKFEGALKDNLSYQQSIENIVGHFIIGVFLLFFTLGLTIFFKMLDVPELEGDLGYWSMLFVGSGALLLIVYIKYFIRRRY